MVGTLCHFPPFISLPLISSLPAYPHIHSCRDAESSIVSGSAQNQLVAGTVETVEVYLNYRNLAEPAFEPRINFSLPSSGTFRHLGARIDNQVRLLYTGVYWDVLGYTEVYWDVLGYTGIYWDVLGYTGIYCDVLGYTEVYYYWFP